MTLHLLRYDLSICRLGPRDLLPDWFEGSGLSTVFRGPEELSILCESRLVPPSVSQEAGWCALKLAGTQPFTLTGVLNSILAPLAEAEVSILAVSTFDTDYVLIKREQLETALLALGDDFQIRYGETDLPVAYPLETPRLFLRRLRLADRDAVFSYAGNRDNTLHMAWATHENAEDTLRFLKLEEENALFGRQYNWGIVEKRTGALVGTVGISRLDPENGSGELGFILHRDLWGRGYAAEAAERVIRFGFVTVGLEKIDAYCFLNNEASRRVLAKLGMRYLGVESVTTLRDDSPRPSHHFELLSADVSPAS